MVSTEKLQGMREYISSHLKDFSNAYNDHSFTETYGTLRGEQHKRLPKVFQTVAETEPLIANKQFYFATELSADLITSNQLTEKLMACYHAGKGMSNFLRKGWHHQ